MAKSKKTPKVHVRKGDRVQIIAGKDKDNVGEVIKVYPRENKVKVQGQNIVYKHQKPRSVNQQGGILEVEGKLDASNVLLYCDKCGKGVRYSKQLNEDGTKSRICKSCGANLDM